MPTDVVVEATVQRSVAAVDGKCLYLLEVQLERDSDDTPAECLGCNPDFRLQKS